MPDINLILEGDGAWPDLVEKKKRGELIHLTKTMQLSALPGGMDSGRPSVAFRLDLPDGKVVVAETSLRLLQLSVRVLTEKYGDQLEKED